jgi:hypothetical protein
MWTAALSFLNSDLIGKLLSLLGYAGAYGKGRADGAAVAERTALERTVEAARQLQDIEDRAARLSDARKRELLRGWSRKP